MMDYDSRGQEIPPTEEQEIDELVDHLAGTHHRLCAYCFEENDIRQQGIEGVNLYDDFIRQQMTEEVAR